MLKERVMELEKLKNINRTPARAQEEDFSVRRRSYEKLIGTEREATFKTYLSLTLLRFKNTEHRIHQLL